MSEDEAPAGGSGFFKAAIERRLGAQHERLSEGERRVAERAVRRQRLHAPQTGAMTEEDRQRAEYPGPGDRLADRMARIGGSWGFIAAFALFLLGWAGANVWMAGRAIDPYPFIFLNLLLSMLAAIQAPVIMMSQNRQAAKDRLAAAHDYEVNLKAEIEIMALHDKLDDIRTQLLEQTLLRQEAHIATLCAALEKAGLQVPPPPREPPPEG